ncbi:hypothetical protein [Breznakiella homolactica]|uniref:Alpha/beta hydrolase n=1 Tax=Breznakiella homolactica TaxID=2798577 RepID=A0A7T8BB64_9SPIR|nr:hypothetical protein [Breznakiella homolactica]QQO10232.1 hypothetical protein JFL75_04745 [Breznakiella homolactica]
MWDLVFLIVIISAFVLLALIRPFVKNLRKIEGLVFLPFLAFLITLGIFIAYGFRPECVLLLVYTAVVSLVHIPQLVSVLGGLRNGEFLERRPLLNGIALVFLIVSAAPALIFAPYDEVPMASEGVAVVPVRDEGLFIRIYPGTGENPRPEGLKRPVFAVIPPMYGSAAAVDRLCLALEAKGFAVLTYSRRDFDMPAFGEGTKQYNVPFFRNFSFYRTLAGVSESGKAALRVRSWEETRTRDIEILLSYIAAFGGSPDSPLASADTGRIIMAGYGAGGAALSLLGASPEFVSGNPGVIGFVSVEGAPASLAVLEVFPWDTPPDGSLPWYAALWESVKRFFLKIHSRGIAGYESPKPLLLPGLFLVSDRVTDTEYRDGRYRSILAMLRASRAPSALAAVPGAGYADYSDIPVKYPLLGFFLSGEEADAWNRDYYIEGTASLMANFGDMVMAGGTGGEPELPEASGDPDFSGDALPPETPEPARPEITRTRVPGTIHIESGGAWNLMPPEYILSQ